jgi:hypothetical protein
MAVTGKSKTSEAGREYSLRAPTRGPPNWLRSSRSYGALRGESMAKSKNDEVNFHIEFTVTKGEHAHVFKFECGDKHVTAAGKGLVRMGGNFEHLRKDQLSALGSLVTDFVGDMGLILLRERR